MFSLQRDWAILWSQLPLSFIYCIYFLLFLSSVLCLHPRVYHGNYKYHLKLLTGLYDKEKEITFETLAAEFISPFEWWSSLAKSYWMHWSSIKKLWPFYMQSDICHLQWEAHFIHGGFTKRERERNRFCKNLAEKTPNLKALLYQDRK